MSCLACPDIASKASISSLLNPAPYQTFTTTSTDVISQIACDTLSRRERGGHVTRGIRKSYKKSPYPHESAPARRSFIDGKSYRPSKRVRVSLDAYLNKADLEKEAWRSRAEWLQDEANRVEAPRPPCHSPLEVQSAGAMRPESGKAILLKELRAEIRSLLSSCINPPSSMLFLALLYLRKLFPYHLDLQRYCDLDCAKVVFRALCVALMFAFKWLDDFTHGIASTISDSDEEFWRRKRANPRKYRTCWSDFMSMSVAQVKDTERYALSVLDWNISVSSSDWYFWLENLHAHSLSHCKNSGYVTVAKLIGAAQYELGRKSSAESPAAAPFMSPSWGRASPSLLVPLRSLERALLVGIPVDLVSVHPDISLDETSEWTSPTAELCCSEDEIVYRPAKVIGCAPGPSYPFKTESDSDHSFVSTQALSIPADFPWTRQDMRALHDFVTRGNQPSSVCAAVEHGDDDPSITPIFLKSSWRVYDFQRGSSVYF
ncbi:hypothetical protein BT96DRAFT_1015261 [Gymnopus androsaceus JB14]|uniref:Uncharacterized protein n=1 Tax=Gymnopus androsaceus JB14 TaxID=1447944 RepID=A0A6A4I2J2_9AGAR|nr:hypothetical protein BT96DRAFT_1015261 [Gymnopus androsaceus JB14]